MQAKAFAKLNLLLNILFKREDGYHELQSIMQSINLHDLLTFKDAAKGITLTCNDPEIPINEKNTVYKAAALLKEKYNVSKGIEIDIQKNIPWGAGLAGGSADAAATLSALNKLWALGLSEDALAELGAQIGSDIPFCLKGGTALVEGRGEKVKQLKPLPETEFLLVIPKINVSTAWVYEQIPANYSAKPVSINEKNILEQLKQGRNELEGFTFKKYPEIKKIKEEIGELGASLSLMSGSGAAVFGIFNKKEALEKAYKKFKENYTATYMVKSMKKALEIS